MMEPSGLASLAVAASLATRVMCHHYFFWTLQPQYSVWVHLSYTTAISFNQILLPDSETYFYKICVF